LLYKDGEPYDEQGRVPTEEDIAKLKGVEKVRARQRKRFWDAANAKYNT
jgi:hypothetical protein